MSAERKVSSAWNQKEFSSLLRKVLDNTCEKAEHESQNTTIASCLDHSWTEIKTPVIGPEVQKFFSKKCVQGTLVHRLEASCLMTGMDNR